MKKNCLFLLFAAAIMITAGCSSLGVNKPEKTPASPAPVKKETVKKVTTPQQHKSRRKEIRKMGIFLFVFNIFFSSYEKITAL